MFCDTSNCYREHSIGRFEAYVQLDGLFVLMGIIILYLSLSYVKRGAIRVLIMAILFAIILIVTVCAFVTYTFIDFTCVEKKGKVIALYILFIVLNVFVLFDIASLLVHIGYSQYAKNKKTVVRSSSEYDI
jgi:hypothetical protein